MVPALRKAPDQRRGAGNDPLPTQQGARTRRRYDASGRSAQWGAGPRGCDRVGREKEGRCVSARRLCGHVARHAAEMSALDGDLFGSGGKVVGLLGSWSRRASRPFAAPKWGGAASRPTRFSVPSAIRSHRNLAQRLLECDGFPARVNGDSKSRRFASSHVSLAERAGAIGRLAANKHHHSSDQPCIFL